MSHLSLDCYFWNEQLLGSAVNLLLTPSGFCFHGRGSVTVTKVVSGQAWVLVFTSTCRCLGSFLSFWRRQGHRLLIRLLFVCSDWNSQLNWGWIFTLCSHSSDCFIHPAFCLSVVEQHCSFLLRKEKNTNTVELTHSHRLAQERKW